MGCLDCQVRNQGSWLQRITESFQLEDLLKIIESKQIKFHAQGNFVPLFSPQLVSKPTKTPHV